MPQPFQEVTSKQQRCEKHQQHHNIDMGAKHEEIPLNRMTSTEERSEKRRIREIFNSFDRNCDGYLDISEMKRLISQQQCESLPKNIARNILEMHDTNKDGLLDFDEFYALAQSQEHSWLLKGLLNRYCKIVVPLPHRDEEGDQTDGAYQRSMKFYPPPLTMVMFSIIEIIIYLYDNHPTSNHSKQEIGERTDGPAAQLFIYNPSLRDQAWRFITYMFVHKGIMHIMNNLIVQIFLGVALELVHCWWRVSLVYLAGVVAGSIGTSIACPQNSLVGASGGVYALITAHVATIIMNWTEMDYAIIQLLVFLIFCINDLGNAVFHQIMNVNDGMGYVAHLSGALAGLLVGIGVLRNLKVRPWERKLWWMAVTLYVALMTAGISIHIFYTHHFQ